jgi:hypothetical protein
MKQNGACLFTARLKESGDLGVKIDKWDLEDLTTKDNIAAYVDEESTT